MRLVGIALLMGAVALGAAAMCVAHPGHPPIPTPTITVADTEQAVPFELFRGNRILFPARVNGHETKVLLDTGASMTTLDRAYARSIGVPEGFKIAGKGAGGAAIDAELQSGLTLQAGGLQITNASVGIMDLGPIGRSIGRPITAVFGRELFDNAVVSIDWEKHQLRIRSHDAFKPPHGAVELTVDKIGPFNTIPISIAGGATIKAMLDLGNGGALTLPQSYWSSRPDLAILRSVAAVAGGVGGFHPARAATVPDVTLAGVSLRSIPTLVTSEDDNDDPTKMANVGIGLLGQFAIDLDLGRERIYLSPRSDRPPFDRDRAGARFDLVGDRLRTGFVSPDGPAAAAGLREGDEIVAVDGKPITSAYYETGDWTRGAAGRHVELTRADAGKIMVTLADFY